MYVIDAVTVIHVILRLKESREQDLMTVRQYYHRNAEPQQKVEHAVKFVTNRLK
jgi:hypothetical protein